MRERVGRAILWAMLATVVLFATAESPRESTSPLKANWRRGSVQQVGPVTVAVADEPLFSRPRAKRGWISEEAARIHLSEPCYYAGQLLAPGEYSIGLIADEHGCGWVGRGSLRFRSPVTVTRFSDEKPKLDMRFDKGAVIAEIAYGDEVSCRSRFVPQSTHDRLMPGLQEYRGRYVTILSDVALPDQLKRMAFLADSAITLFSRWSDLKHPERPLVVYLLGDERDYERVAWLLGGSDAEEFKGFASPITRRAYLRSPLRDDAALWPPAALPAQGLQLLFHELNHVFMYSFDQYKVWPTWLVEGIAESFSYNALAVLEIPGADELEVSARLELRELEVFSRVPHIQDFLAGNWRVGSLYPTARAFVDELRLRDEALFKDLLLAVNIPRSSAAVAATAELKLREFYGPASQLLAQAIAKRRGNADAVASFGEWVPVQGATLFIPPRNYSAGFWRTRAPDDVVTIEFEGAFLPSGQPQFDAVLGRASGYHTQVLLKVALQPEGATLMYHQYGEWEQMQYKTFQQPLAVGTLLQPVWHKFKVEYSAQGTLVNCSVSGQDPFYFHATSRVQQEMESCALTCFDSAGLLRNVSIRTEKQQR